MLNLKAFSDTDFPAQLRFAQPQPKYETQINTRVTRIYKKFLK